MSRSRGQAHGESTKLKLDVADAKIHMSLHMKEGNNHQMNYNPCGPLISSCLLVTSHATRWRPPVHCLTPSSRLNCSSLSMLSDPDFYHRPVAPANSGHTYSVTPTCHTSKASELYSQSNFQDLSSVRVGCEDVREKRPGEMPVSRLG